MAMHYSTPCLSERQCSDQAFSDQDLEVVAFDAHLEALDVLRGGHGEHLARADIEARAMARTLDLEVVQLAFGERTVIVRADVLDGVVRPAHVKMAM